ncbi:MAG: DUF4350 domain-containing protein [Spirosomataceae bacterium]
MTLTRFYTVFLVLLFVGYVLVEYYRPKPVSWIPTFTNVDKIPFGTKATFELIKEVFPNQKIQTVRLPIYNELTENQPTQKSSYLFINQSFNLDKTDLRELFGYVNNGNHVFIASEEFSGLLEDTLGVRLKFDLKSSNKKNIGINFVNSTFHRPHDYHFEKGSPQYYFSLKDSVDKSQVLVLGKNSKDSINFLKINVGLGAFYLHCIPKAFTNYYVLKPETSDYAFKALSYLPVAPVYWDEYQKQGRIGENSIFRFVHSQPPLEWAFYIAIIGIFLFVIFEGKRRQRIIPVIESPKNTSLAFVKTIGTLYFQQKDHSNLAHKKVTYFLANLRQQFYLQTNVIDNEFQQSLAHKSGVELADIQELFKLIEQVQTLGYLSETQLIELNDQIESFYRNAR